MRMISGSKLARSLALGCACALGATVSVAQVTAGIVVPSGLGVQVMDVIDESDQNVVRFRYLAPDLGDPLRRPDFDALSADLETLCQTNALPQLMDRDLLGVQIIVSLSDKELDFGVIDPDITQVFEAYTVENNSCILEMF